MNLNELIEVPNNHKPSTEEIATAIRQVLKKHLIRGSISKSKTSVKVDFGVIFDNLTPAGKKRLELVSSNLGEKGNWSDLRFKKQHEVAKSDGVEDRYMLAIQEIANVAKKLGATQIGYVKPVEGTSGFGGYRKNQEFEMFPVSNVSVSEKWIDYPIFKVSLK